MKTGTSGFHPAVRGTWEPKRGVLEKYISFVYKLKQPTALCCCGRNGLGKQVILMVLIQEPHLKNYRFSVTWYSNHHTRRGKLMGWPESLVLSEDDLLNPQVDYAIQYGRHRGQGYPLVFWHLALLSKHNPGGKSSVYLAAEWPFVWRGHHQKSVSNIR